MKAKDATPDRLEALERRVETLEQAAKITRRACNHGWRRRDGACPDCTADRIRGVAVGAR